MEKPQMAATVILAMAASDVHVVANALIAMMLRGEGYDVINLGAATSIDEVMDAYQRFPQSIAIIIGSINGHARDDLAGLSTAKRDFQVRCPIIIGGNLSVGAIKDLNEPTPIDFEGVDYVLKDPQDLLPVLDKLRIRSRYRHKVTA